MPDDGQETVSIPAKELDLLLAVATVYVESFTYSEWMSLSERLALRDVEAVVGKYGKRY